MVIDELQVERRYYDTLWDEEHEEKECNPCGAAFRTRIEHVYVLKSKC